MYAGLAVCYWAVTLTILFALGPVLLFIVYFVVLPGDLGHKVDGI